MEMINVLKRLAELDANNPNVEPKLTESPSLATVRDSILEESIDDSVSECGMMGAVSPAGSSHTPASIHITANSGDELSGMIRDIMSLAGVDKAETHHEIELGAPHAVATDNGDDFANLIGMIDKNSDDTLNPSDDEEEKENWDNSPEPEIEPHDYGDKQVKPKPQGLKQRMGDNPYKPAQESIEEVASQLMDEYRQFIGESGITELSKGAKWKYTDLGRKSADQLASKAADADDRDVSDKLINKAIKRQGNVRKVEKNLVGEKTDCDESSDLTQSITPDVHESLDDLLHLALGNNKKN